MLVEDFMVLTRLRRFSAEQKSSISEIIEGGWR